MRSRRAWIIAGGLTAAAPIAWAQTLDTANLREVDDDAALTYQGRSVDQLEDMDVLRNGEKIGEIEGVLASPDDQIVAVVVEYDEGFLDLDDQEVVLSIDQLQFDDNAQDASLTLGDADLEALPAWDD